MAHGASTRGLVLCDVLDTSPDFSERMSQVASTGGDYAAAALAAVPQARQCADRFHLLQNLGKALEGVLTRHLAAHRKQQTETARAGAALPGRPAKSLPKKVALSQAKREERLVHYQQVVALREQGFSQTAIAQQVGVGRSTVSRWISIGAFPEQQPRPRKARVAPHLPHLIEQWETGCYTVAQLHRELLANGYPHSYDSVYRQLRRTLRGKRKRQYVRASPKECKQQALIEPRYLVNGHKPPFLKRSRPVCRLTGGV